jgi:ABC-type nitrate/sulfonate/bicarbonate transport system substrate-binding protein
LTEQNIKTAEDMIGKRVGVFPTQELSYRLLLALAGIEPTAIDYIPITEFSIRPLMEGEVDVLSGYATNEPLQAQELGYEVNIVSTNDYGVSLPAQVIFTTEDMVKNKADLVQRFVRASLKGYETVIEDPEQGLLATLKVDETLDANHQENIIQAVIPLVAPDQQPVGFMNQKVWQQTVDVLIEQDILQTSVDPQTVYTTQFLE